jgi:uncharacterized membrane protein YphA (DoxX/SURF4 family)
MSFPRWNSSFVANRYWHAPAAEQFALANDFYEHLGLVGGFVLVAGYDLREKVGRTSP